MIAASRRTLRSPRRGHEQTTAKLLAAAALLVSAGYASAQPTRTWRTAGDGAIDNPANWVAGAIPGVNDNAQFGLVSSTTPFTVSFPGAFATQRLTITNQRPVFDLGGFTYQVTGDVLLNGLNSPQLGVRNGMLSTFNLIKQAVGNASILVDSGGQLSITNVVETYGPGTSFNWTVSGPGSRASIGQVVRMHESNPGTVRVENGGAIDGQSGSLELAIRPGSEATLEVDGADSSVALWAVRTFAGSGSVEVTNGGSLRTFDEFVLGRHYGAGNNSLLVRGEGSALVVGDYPNTGGGFLVGFEHNSSDALVDQGGRVQALNNSYIGHRGTGSLTIDGDGSEFESPYRLHVGWENSHGRFTLTNGARASVGSLWMNTWNTGESETLLDSGSLLSSDNQVEIYEASTLTIRNNAGLETLAGLNSGARSDREPVINLVDGGYLFTTGRIDLGCNGFDPCRATLNLEGGTVLCLDYIPVNDGGTIRGYGDIISHISVNGVLNPTGMLTVNSANLSPNAAFAVMLDPGASARLLSIGPVNLGGTLRLSPAKDLAPSMGQTFEILSSGTNQCAGTFAAVTGQDAGPGLAFMPVYAADRVQVRVDGVIGFDIAATSLAVPEGFSAPALDATASFTLSPAANVAASVTWSSDNPLVATVDAKGVVTGTGPGSTMIRGTFAGFNDAVGVTVRATPSVTGASPGLATTRYFREFPNLDMLAPFTQGTRDALWFNNELLNQQSGLDDYIGVRLEGSLNVPADGDYVFDASVDDYLAIWLDGRQISSRACCGNTTPVTVALSAGAHDIRVDFVGTVGADGLDVRWSGPGFAARTVAGSDLVGGAVNATYYDARPLPITEDVPDLDLYTGILLNTAPNIDLPLYPNGWLSFNMQRFEGQLSLPDDAQYTFTLNVDDDAKVWIDDELVLDPAWSNFAFPNAHTFTRAYARGVYPIRVDYTEHGGHFAGIQLRLSAPGIADQIIPARAFSHGGSPEPRCPADWNADKTLNSQDFFDFLASFFSGEADFNDDSTTNSQDFFDFITAFFVGCP